MNKVNSGISQFLDKEGRIMRLPAKKSVRIAVLFYLAQKFELDKKYTEKEVNEICDHWHIFQDYFILRRSLVDEGLLFRKNDGSCYWRNEEFGFQNVGDEVKEYE